MSGAVFQILSHEVVDAALFVLLGALYKRVRPRRRIVRAVERGDPPAHGQPALLPQGGNQQTVIRHYADEAAFSETLR